MLERINLVPRRPLAERIRKATLPVLGLCLSLVLLFLAGSDKILQNRIRALDREVAISRQSAREAAEFQARVQALVSTVNIQKEEKERLGAAADRLTIFHERKRYFSEILAVIAETMPAAVRCESVTFKDNGGRITGTALQYRELPSFVKALENHPQFAQALLQDLDRAPKGEATDFVFTIAFQLKL